MQANGLTFEEGSVTLDGATLLTLTSPEIKVNANASGVISASLGGTVGLTKTGAGPLTLTASNSFTGETTVQSGRLVAAGAAGDEALGTTSGIRVNNSGTLLLGAADQINDSAPMKLGDGTGSQATFNTGGFSERLGTLTLATDSIIDLANGASVIAFANSSAETWAGSLSIYNWSGSQTGDASDRVYFGNDGTGLLDSQLSQITFFSGPGTGSFGPGAQILADGQIVPVPEPATVFGGLALLGIVGYRERRQLGKLWRSRTK